jgi:hypothetical protein
MLGMSSYLLFYVAHFTQEVPALAGFAQVQTDGMIFPTQYPASASALAPSSR